MGEGQRTEAEGQRIKKIKGINIHGLVIFRSEELKRKNNSKTCT